MRCSSAWNVVRRISCRATRRATAARTSDWRRAPVTASLPELVTVLAAVRLGAVTLAVGDIIGGNSFDVLFVAVADVAFRDGSIYHAADDQSIFLMSVTIVLTAVLAAGMIGRERRHIGFEGVAILGFYALGIGSLIAMG